MRNDAVTPNSASSLPAPMCAHMDASCGLVIVNVAVVNQFAKIFLCSTRYRMKERELDASRSQAARVVQQRYP